MSEYNKDRPHVACDQCGCLVNWTMVTDCVFSDGLGYGGPCSLVGMADSESCRHCCP